MKGIRWQLKPLPPLEKAEHLAKSINISLPIANILCQRGIDTFEKAKDYFRPALKNLHDPFLMKDMDKAVERLNEAIYKNQKILIYGDYDVDGTTSVSLVYSFLRDVYRNVEYYIPDRYTEGYGISIAGIDYAQKQDVSLIISLDCGIKAVDKIEYANSKGIDFIICDHHLPDKKIPDAVAVLDPKRPDCAYPYKELSGCGVGFKLLQAFAQQNGIEEKKLYGYLDFLAISIAADIVPITGENRIFAYYGLKKINQSPTSGISALKKLCGFDKDINISNIVFGFAPRINASGRLEHAKYAVELLISKSEERAYEMGEKINKHNTDRRELDSNITLEAISMIENSEFLIKSKSAVLYNEKWHKGVLGIVASRCIETYYRPTIVLTKNNGHLSGSARSVHDFDIYEAISACSHLLEQYGGHKYAAGLMLREENLQEFINSFEQIVSKKIKDEQLSPKMDVDLEIDFEDINWKFFNVMNQMQPYGPENMQPVFVTRNVKDNGYSKVVGENHLKLSMIQKDSKPISGIAFGMKDVFEKIKDGQLFDICYSIEENEYMGKKTLQLKVRDIKLS